MSGGFSAILVDIFLASRTVRIADVDLYISNAEFAVDSNEDYIVDSDGNYLVGSGTGDVFYKKALINAPSITRQLPEEASGVISERSITLQIADNQDTIDDTWKDIIEAEDIRGRQIKLYRYAADGLLSFSCWGKIHSYSLKDGIELAVSIFDNESLEVELPRHTITADRFTDSALDAGQPINIPLGYCTVPLYNIKNDPVNDHFDYLIGYGGGGIEGLRLDAAGNRGIHRGDSLVTASEYTLYDGTQASPYPGYAFVRFNVEQKAFSGSYFKLTADVKGLKLGGSAAERNFATVIYHFITNTVWGLGQAANLKSFEEAAAYLGTDWKCDGAITSTRQAGDILNDLLFACRGTLDMNSKGERTIAIGQPGSSVASFGCNDGYWNNAETLQVRNVPVSDAIKTLTLKYGTTHGSSEPVYEITGDVCETFGVDRTVEPAFVEDHDTAKRVFSYIRNLAIWSFMFIDAKFSLEFKEIRKGDIISYTDPRNNISGDWIVWEKTTNNRDDYRATLRKYSSSIYGLDTITTPTTLVIGGAENDLNALVGPMTIGNSGGTPTRVVIKPGGSIRSSEDPESAGGTLITDVKLAGYKSNGDPVFEFDYNGQIFWFDGSVIAAGTITATHIGANKIITSDANIDNLVVKSAHIDNLTIGTGKIANNAVNIIISNYSNSSVYGDSSYTVRRLWDEDITMDADGEIIVFATITNNIQSSYLAGIYIDGTLCYITNQTSSAIPPPAYGKFTFTMIGRKNVTAGTKNIEVQWVSGSASSEVLRSAIVIEGVKK